MEKHPYCFDEELGINVDRKYFVLDLGKGQYGASVLIDV